MIKILYFEGCQYYRAAVALAQEVASQADPPVRIDVIEVTTPEEAGALGFLGSPTVQVNGRDVEPGVVVACPEGFACRTYRVGGTIARIPPREWIEDALRVAGVRLVTERAN